MMSGRKILLNLVFIAMHVGCASKYTVPQQSFSGAIGSINRVRPFSNANLEALKATPRKPPKSPLRVVILHLGLDQIPNYRFQSIQLDLAEQLQEFREELMKTNRFSKIEVVGISQWHPQSTEDLRRIGVLYDAQYIITLSAYYDFIGFFSDIGHFVGWVPYINFVTPMYKLEASLKTDVVIQDTTTGGFVYTDSAHSTQRERSSSWFTPEHTTVLSRRLHRVVFSQLKEKILGWFHG